MPLTRSTTGAEDRPAPITIARADVAGMTPGDAHEAILGALDAGEQAARAARGMIDDAVIDAAVAAMVETRATVTDHAPWSGAESGETWCRLDGPDVRFPCPTYRSAAGVIADGLTP